MIFVLNSIELHGHFACILYIIKIALFLQFIFLCLFLNSRHFHGVLLGSGMNGLEFISKAKERGVKKIFLATDRDNNEKVNMFYSNSGFIKVREYITKEGRWINEYLYEIDKEK